MNIFMFLFTLWAIGFLITIIHELGHAWSSNGKTDYIQIGIAIWKPITIGKIRVYPILPFGGATKVAIENPTKKRVVLFASAGIANGTFACILVGIFGFCLLSPEAIAEVIRTHKLRFLINAIISGSAGFQSTIATAFISSAIIYGVQQVGNILPAPGYDGHLIFKTIFPR